MEVIRAACVVLAAVASRVTSQETELIPLVFNNITFWEGDPCVIPEEGPGVCSKLQNCKRLEQAVLTGYCPQICSYEKYISIVCCPLADYQPTELSQQTTQPPSGKAKEACETYGDNLTHMEDESNNISTQVSVIVGGVLAKKEEFPHMAAIGYGAEGDISWLCGGSLISLRFVLTAGHCLRSRQKGPVNWVRLGDRNLKLSFGSHLAQQFSVAERIAHPKYHPPSRYNDVALLKLDRDVTRSEAVGPACLHTGEPISGAVATGWGLTQWVADKGSADLMTVNLDVQPPELCEEEYRSLVGTRRLRTGFDNDSMLCVGNLEGGKDTCQGDSGGPYQMKMGNNQLKLYSIIGVTSFGLNECGAKNSPAVYSRVSYFVPWIESVVWP